MGEREERGKEREGIFFSVSNSRLRENKAASRRNIEAAAGEHTTTRTTISS